MQIAPTRRARLSAARLVLSAGPVLILLVWGVAGQWDAAGAEPRAWLQFSGIVCLASLMPLPGCAVPLDDRVARLTWWGWVAVMGLLVTS